MNKAFKEISIRERNAWIAERVMGWQHGFQDDDLLRHVPGWVDKEAQCWIGFSYDVMPLIQDEYGEDREPFEQAYIGPLWSPCTDANHDYSVLVRVRETWSGSDLKKFAQSLRDIFSDRASDRDFPAIWNCLYEPGDYSAAAYAVLADEPELNGL